MGTPGVVAGNVVCSSAQGDGFADDPWSAGQFNVGTRVYKDEWAVSQNTLNEYFCANNQVKAVKYNCSCGLDYSSSYGASCKNTQ